MSDRPPLLLVVDRDAAEPVYRQVARQVREAIATGALAPGERLPPVRALAGELGVNLNTIARAWRLLAEEGFLEVRGRSGARVRAPGDGPPADGAPTGTAPEGLQQGLREVLARLRQSGLSPDQIRRLLAREIERLGTAVPREPPG